MANQEQLAQLRQGTQAWNRWRQQIKEQTGRAVAVDLRGADLNQANLSKAKLNGVDLSRATLCEADLRKADLSFATLVGADLRRAQLQGASLLETDLRGADLREARLCEAKIAFANVHGANLREADLGKAFLCGMFSLQERGCANLHSARWVGLDVQRSARGRGTTLLSAYREPLLRALIELGGSAHKTLVFDRVGAIMKPILQEVDYASFRKVHRGEHILWRQYVAWQRHLMVEEGLLSATSPKGVLKAVSHSSSRKW